jgi:hypothetical protein
MPKRVKTRKNADVNQIAAAIVALTDREQEPEVDTRNQAMTALSKLGAAKGGRVRAKKLSP